MAMSDKSLKRGMLVLVAIAIILVGLYAYLMIGGTVIGSIANVVTGGSIPVSTAMNTSLAGLEGDYISDSEAVATNSPFIIALVAIVVLILVFGIKFKFGGGSKGKSVE